MTQSYRSQLRHHLKKARENIVLCRVNLRDAIDDIDALQNRYALQYAEAEVRQFKRRYAQSHHFRPYLPIEY